MKLSSRIGYWLPPFFTRLMNGYFSFRYNKKIIIITEPTDWETLTVTTENFPFRLTYQRRKSIFRLRRFLARFEVPISGPGRTGPGHVDVFASSSGTGGEIFRNFYRLKLDLAKPPPRWVPYEISSEPTLAPSRIRIYYIIVKLCASCSTNALLPTYRSGKKMFSTNAKRVCG